MYIVQPQVRQKSQSKDKNRKFVVAQSSTRFIETHVVLQKKTLSINVNKSALYAIQNQYYVLTTPYDKKKYYFFQFSFTCMINK